MPHSQQTSSQADRTTVDPSSALDLVNLPNLGWLKIISRPDPIEALLKLSPSVRTRFVHAACRDLRMADAVVTIDDRRTFDAILMSRFEELGIKSSLIRASCAGNLLFAYREQFVPHIARFDLCSDRALHHFVFDGVMNLSLIEKEYQLLKIESQLEVLKYASTPYWYDSVVPYKLLLPTLQAASAEQRNCALAHVAGRQPFVAAKYLELLGIDSHDVRVEIANKLHPGQSCERALFILSQPSISTSVLRAVLKEREVFPQDCSDCGGEIISGTSALRLWVIEEILSGKERLSRLGESAKELGQFAARGADLSDMEKLIAAAASSREYGFARSVISQVRSELRSDSLARLLINFPQTSYHWYDLVHASPHYGDLLLNLFREPKHHFANTTFKPNGKTPRARQIAFLTGHPLDSESILEADVELTATHSVPLAHEILSLGALGREKKLFPNWPAAFSSEVNDAAIALRLLGYMFFHNRISTEIPITSDAVQISRWALSRAVGCSALQSGISDATLSANSSRAIYGTFLALSSALSGVAIDSYINITPQLLSKDHRSALLRFLNAYRCAISMQITPGQIVELVESPPLDGPIAQAVALQPEKLAQATTTLMNASVQRFKQQFALSDEVTGDDFLELIESYDDFSPVIKLASRFRERFGRDKEATKKNDCLLSQVLSSMALDTFAALKYQDGLESYERQIGFLSAQQERIWRENRTRLTLCPDEATAPIDLLAGALEIINSNLVPHCQELGLIEARALAGEKPIVAERRSRIVTDIVLAARNGAEQEVRELIANIRNNTARYGLNGSDVQQVRRDLDAISAALSQRDQTDANIRPLFFSCITDDPLLMICIGKLVDTSSCQDYEIGSQFESLPGYVIDANIKAALGFAIRPQDFSAAGYAKSDFELVVQSLDNPGALRYQFNPKKRMLLISSENGPIVLPLGLAKRRHILRLGSTEAKAPYILTERGYIQNFPQQSLLDLDLSEHIATLQRDIGQQAPQSRVDFPASRNYYGVYSDALGGIKTGWYSWNVQSAAELTGPIFRELVFS